MYRRYNTYLSELAWALLDNEVAEAVLSCSALETMPDLLITIAYLRDSKKIKQIIRRKQ